MVGSDQIIVDKKFIMTFDVFDHCYVKLNYNYSMSARLQFLIREQNNCYFIHFQTT